MDDNIKYGMIEAIAHLLHRDYEAIVEDFVTLDFIPEGSNLQPILPVLARVSTLLQELLRSLFLLPVPSCSQFPLYFTVFTVFLLVHETLLIEVVLVKVFDQALEGGGAKNFNFQELAADLAQITFDYPFRIPPYFALIIRAIGVLEGIALVGNPDFALVDEAYPYLSKRLLTDDSDRLRESLR